MRTISATTCCRSSSCATSLNNYEMAAKKELGRDYPDPNATGNGGHAPLSAWYTAHCLVKPGHLWTSIAHMARTPNDELLTTLQAGFKFIENESFQSTFGGCSRKSISALQARPDTR